MSPILGKNKGEKKKATHSVPCQIYLSQLHSCMTGFVNHLPTELSDLIQGEEGQHGAPCAECAPYDEHNELHAERKQVGGALLAGDADVEFLLLIVSILTAQAS